MHGCLASLASPPGHPPAKDYHPEDESFYAMRREAWIEGWEAANEKAD